jgi:hypothetical protein
MSAASTSSKAKSAKAKPFISMQETVLCHFERESGSHNLALLDEEIFVFKYEPSSNSR